MYFSISAPQSVTLPDGKVLSFRVNAQDTSLCEIHILGTGKDDVEGTHILTFKRNGAPSDTSFTPVAKPAAAVDAPAYKDDGPVPTVPGTPIPVAKPGYSSEGKGKGVYGSNQKPSTVDTKASA